MCVGCALPARLGHAGITTSDAIKKLAWHAAVFVAVAVAAAAADDDGCDGDGVGGASSAGSGRSWRQWCQGSQRCEDGVR